MLTSMPARSFATKKDDKKTETETDQEAPVKKRRRTKAEMLADAEAKQEMVDAQVYATDPVVKKARVSRAKKVISDLEGASDTTMAAVKPVAKRTRKAKVDPM